MTAANTFTLSASPTLTPNVAITTAGNVTVYRMPSPLYSTPIPVAQSMLIRSRAFENGRPDGPIRSEMYFALDAAAQAVTSTLPIVLSHTFNTAIQNNNTPVKSYLMIFEPKAPDMLSRMTNPPDLVSQATLNGTGHRRAAMTSSRWPLSYRTSRAWIKTASRWACRPTRTG